VAADFPYKWSTTLGRKLDTYMRSRNEEILGKLVITLQADPARTGALLVLGGAHGHELQYEYVQLRTGVTRIRAWSDVTNQISENLDRIPIDIADEMKRLRKEHRVLPAMHMQEVPGRGRVATIFVATADDSTWITCATPAAGQRLADTAVDRIFGVVFPR
jgi:hypothetical protein